MKALLEGALLGGRPGQVRVGLVDLHAGDRSRLAERVHVVGRLSGQRHLRHGAPHVGRRGRDVLVARARLQERELGAGARLVLRARVVSEAGQRVIELRHLGAVAHDVPAVDVDLPHPARDLARDDPLIELDDPHGSPAAGGRPSGNRRPTETRETTGANTKRSAGAATPCRAVASSDRSSSSWTTSLA
jgi:hypothetical protein